MKKLLSFFILIGLAFSFMAVAAENDSSGLVGTLGGGVYNARSSHGENCRCHEN